MPISRALPSGGISRGSSKEVIVFVALRSVIRTTRSISLYQSPTTYFFTPPSTIFPPFAGKHIVFYSSLSAFASSGSARLARSVHYLLPGRRNLLHSKFRSTSFLVRDSRSERWTIRSDCVESEMMARNDDGSQFDDRFVWLVS